MNGEAMAAVVMGSIAFVALVVTAGSIIGFAREARENTPCAPSRDSAGSSAAAGPGRCWLGCCSASPSGPAGCDTPTPAPTGAPTGLPLTHTYHGGR